MHSGTVGRADGFLRRRYRELAASPTWRPGTLLVVTYDEGSHRRAYTAGAVGAWPTRCRAGRPASP